MLSVLLSLLLLTGEADAQPVVEVTPLIGSFDLRGELAPFDVMVGARLIEQTDALSSTTARLSAPGFVPSAVLVHYRYIAETAGWTTKTFDAAGLLYSARKNGHYFEVHVERSGTDVTWTLTAGACLVDWMC